MGEGTIIELDKLAGEPVDILVNHKPIAKGEVVVIDENFGVRVTKSSLNRKDERFALKNSDGVISWVGNYYEILKIYSKKSLCAAFFFAFSFLLAQTVENQTEQEIDTQITENALSSYQDETRYVLTILKSRFYFQKRIQNLNWFFCSHGCGAFSYYWLYLSRFLLIRREEKYRCQ